MVAFVYVKPPAPLLQLIPGGWEGPNLDHKTTPFSDTVVKAKQEKELEKEHKKREEFKTKVKTQSYLLACCIESERTIFCSRNEDEMMQS